MNDLALAISVLRILTMRAQRIIAIQQDALNNGGVIPDEVKAALEAEIEAAENNILNG